MSYQKVEDKDIRKIQSIIGDSTRVLVGEAISEDYSHDEMDGVFAFPEVLVKVKTTDEVAELLSYTYQRNIPVTPRGTGTGLVGAAVPVEKGILLDLSLMNQFLELDIDNLTLTVEPGVLLMDIYDYVGKEGLFYPPDPGEKSATIGGNISTNAGGMRAVKYGVTRDYVAGLEVVLPHGSVVNLGGKVVKNSSGYDLKGLLIGSEGTLGVITKATLKLLPMPEHVMSLLVPFNKFEKAVDAVPHLMRAKVTPTAVEFIEREVILDAETYLSKAFPDQTAPAYLLLKYDANSKEQLEQDCDAVSELCLSLGAVDVLISDTEERERMLWSAREAFLEAIKGSTTQMDEVDVVVPRSKVSEMITYICAVQQQVDIKIKTFGHAGDGNVHAYILRDQLDQATWKLKLEDAMELIYKKAKVLGGQVSGEHGIGYVKREYLAKSLDEDVMDLMWRIKKVFDPKNLLNPSKVVTPPKGQIV